MERCKNYLVTEPETRKGTWKKPGRSLKLEIGCGKGSFTCALASAEQECDLVAIEKVPDAMILAMERAQAAKLNNVCFLDYDAARLREVFSPGELECIYINFCDPWPKSRDAKFRLTAPAFMQICCRRAERFFSKQTMDRYLNGLWNSSKTKAGRSGN